jgi:hypothetical protein
MQNIQNRLFIFFFAILLPAIGAMAEIFSPEVIAFDPSAMQTNMNKVRMGDGTIRLEVGTSLTPETSYWAEMKADISKGGKYYVWILGLPCNKNWVANFKWAVDGGQYRPVKNFSEKPAAASGLTWTCIGTVNFKSGNHSLKIQLTSPRSYPDDAWMFRLARVILVNSDKFIPKDESMAVEYDPQAYRGGMQVESKNVKDAAPSVDVKTTNITDEQLKPLTLQINTRNSLGKVNPIWRDYSEGAGGLPADFLSGKVSGRYIKALRPRFIRKDHCIDEAAKRQPDGTLSFDFTPGLNQIKDILACGATPIAGLDFFPSAIYQGIPTEQWGANPKFRKEWGETVTSFLEALKANGLADKVTYFQCFNEPDYCGFREESRKNTRHEIYLVAARAVKKTFPNAKMMGFG